MEERERQEETRAFRIDARDNVATALTELKPGEVKLLGDGELRRITAVTEVPVGHKIALTDLEPGDDVIKYGVRIARAYKPVKAGEWVHLHNVRSVYDERSSHLDAVTGAPKDISYE